jgi:hypothetical protein
MTEVIDWDEAMQQCGDDEEFLRELLGDLKAETDAQMVKIEETIRVRDLDRVLTMTAHSASMRQRAAPCLDGDVNLLVANHLYCTHWFLLFFIVSRIPWSLPLSRSCGLPT